MIDPERVRLFIPGFIIDQNKFKIHVFRKVGETVGGVIERDAQKVIDLPDDLIPCIGCSPEFFQATIDWRQRGRKFIYWDRGYLRRVFATWLPRAKDRPSSFYRWHVGSFQMQGIDNVPPDRWDALGLQNQFKPWNRNGRHIVILDVGPDYWNLHVGATGWAQAMKEFLKAYTKRDIVIRDKESAVPLYEELKEAHACVSHGSIGAVEAVIWGCPVFVHRDSAAAIMGRTKFTEIESPRYPDYEERQRWVESLAYHQWNEHEMNDGTLWRMLRDPSPS